MHNLVFDLRQSTAINCCFKVDLKYSGHNDFIYMTIYTDDFLTFVNRKLVDISRYNTYLLRIFFKNPHKTQQ